MMLKKGIQKPKKVRESRIISPFGRNTVLPNVSEETLNTAINSSIVRIKKIKRSHRIFG